MYDTVKGSDWLGDQDAIEYLCRNAAEAVYELDHFGVPFSRTEEGKIYQRPFGGMTTNFGEGIAQRTCAAADRTGHAILHTLYGQSLRHDTEFFIEYFALDLIMDEDRCVGVIALEMSTGTLHRFQAKQVILATGGYGRAYFSATSAHTCTGDGSAMVIRAGLPLQDMEFVQFHPTCLYHPQDRTFLITEALRGEGAQLKLPDGTRFMPNHDERAELASRDIVSQSIDSELKKSGESHVYLDCTHLDMDAFINHFPNIYKKCLEHHIDIKADWIPVVPASHYLCGGIEVNKKGMTTINSLFACGECSRTGLHGANRLASNSLLEALVYAHNIYKYHFEFQMNS